MKLGHRLEPVALQAGRARQLPTGLEGRTGRQVMQSAERSHYKKVGVKAALLGSLPGSAANAVM